MIISISGTPGSGKGTVSSLLVEKLGLKKISIGDTIMRPLAKKRGVSVLELMELAQTDESIDRDADKKVIELGEKEDNFIIDSRTAFHFIPQSFKIFIKVDPKEAAKRIWKDILSRSKGREIEGTSQTVEELEQRLISRNTIDRKRYQKYYNFDFTDESQYDLVIDSTNLTPQEEVDKIVSALK